MKISKNSVLVTLAAILAMGHSLNAQGTGAQRIKALVLNDLSGKPQEGIEIHYACEDGHIWPTDQRMTTDSNGFAEVPYPCASGVKFKIWTYILGGKLEECGEMEGQTLQTILDVGIISDPRAAGGIWCPARISKSVKPVPGQVIIFVKKPTWWQSHIAG